MPSVGAAGLLGPEDAHYRGAPSPSRPYSKNAPVPSVRIWRSVCYMELRTTRQDNILADWQATILFTWKEYRRLGYYVNTNRGYKILPLVEKLALEIQLGKGSSSG